VGRLSPGATAAAARAEVETMLQSWRTWVPAGHVPNDSTHRMQLAPLRDEVVGNVRQALWVLQGAVVLVLLIACANVANLLLARAEARHRELAVRTALGAGRLRILRQFMAEGLVVSALGAMLGLALAYWGLKALLAAYPQGIPRASEISVDPMVLAFTGGVTLLTAMVFALAPLFHIHERAVTESIKEGGVRTTGNAARNRIRRGLAVSEIALAVMLVIGAGLLIRTFRNLTSVDAGFDPENRITFGVVLPQPAYPDSQRVAQFYGDLVRRLGEIPGVRSAAAMQGLPPFRRVNANDTEFEGIAPSVDGPPQNVDYYQVATAGYFETMGIRLAAGRSFHAADAVGAPVAIINQALARRFYPDQDPLGRRIRPSFGPNVPWFTIVGVAEDVNQGGLEAEPGTELYLNFEQGPRIVGFAPRQMNLVLESTRPLEAVATEIRRAVATLDPALPVVQLRTMDAVVGDSLVRQRFLSLLLAVFAGVALALAAIGTYGILAYMVAERRREIGIRMALGADHRNVMKLVLGQGMMIALLGVGLGVAGALVLGRVTRSLLYGVSPSDPLTFAGVAVAIGIVALAASLVPTRRATRVDPVTVIAAE
jgi:predicted permease